jgi:hypothetical protein
MWPLKAPGSDPDVRVTHRQMVRAGVMLFASLPPEQLQAAGQALMGLGAALSSLGRASLGMAEQASLESERRVAGELGSDSGSSGADHQE